MVALDKVLYKTRKTIKNACIELGVNAGTTSLEQCYSCGIWLNYKELLVDLDKNLICKHCEFAYGL